VVLEVPPHAREIDNGVDPERLEGGMGTYAGE
jgi:hypothetical protein